MSQTGERILGIDPGMATMGFGCVQVWGASEQAEVLEYGIISTPPQTPVPERLQVLFEDLTTVLEQLQPQRVGIENRFFF